MKISHIRCPVHAGALHGAEAEELRSGMEELIEFGPLSVRSVQELIDRVDARDSLAHCELVADVAKWRARADVWKRLAKEYYFRLDWSADQVETEVDAMFDDEPRCATATHGARNSTCTCEDSRDELRETTDARCPICDAPGEVRALGAWGFAAHCSGCYEGDPEALAWRRLQGHGETPEDAVASWLEDARELCSVDEIPPLRIPYSLSAPRLLSAELRAQVAEESILQSGLDLVDGWRWVKDEQTGHKRPQDVIYAEFTQ